MKLVGSNMMSAKGVKDYLVKYQSNDMVCFTISVVGTAADLTIHICGNIPGLKKVTPVATFTLVECKSFIHFCQTGNITFSCKDRI